jgi:hypothetical protein
LIAANAGKAVLRTTAAESAAIFILLNIFYRHRGPPVIGGPFCAIATEVPPASNAATIA